MKRIISFLLTTVLVLSISGCAATSGNEEVEKEVVKEVQSNEDSKKEEKKEEAVIDPTQDIKDHFLEKANEVEVTDTHVVFKDASEREVLSIEKGPKKVAILYSSYTNLWYETGGTAQGIIGGKSSSVSYIDNIGRDISEDENMTILATSASGKKWDVETIIAFEPDLIIVSTAMSGFKTISDPAEVAGIPVIAVDYNSFSDYLKWSKVFSSINGNEDKFEEVAINTLNEVADIVVKTEGLESPKVAPIMFYSESSIKLLLPGTSFGEILKDLGAENIGSVFDNPDSNTRIPFNLEQLLTADPNYILVYGKSGAVEDVQNGIEAAYADTGVWENLPAVKNGNTHYLDKYLYHYKANKNYALAYKIVAEIIYPEIKNAD